MIDITNEVLTKLKTELSPIKVMLPSQNNASTFPCVTFKEVSNVVLDSSIDSSGEVASQLAFEVNIFTKGNTKESSSRTIRQQVDTVLSTYYGMNRDFSNDVENYGDVTIYRYVMRYSCVVDRNKTIYRG